MPKSGVPDPMTQIRVRMAPFTIVFALLGAGASDTAAQAPAPGPPAIEAPKQRALYRNGQNGRYLLDGQWLFRQDHEDAGIRGGFARQQTTDGWSPVEIPHAWNATDLSDASARGSIGWYRKDFRAPRAPARTTWLVRFESVNYRARVFLNGRELGRHEGAYVPFELPASSLRRGRVNRLIVRVDSRRRNTDIPAARRQTNGRPGGGWWNYGGLLREVYLRRVDTVDWASVVVRPTLPNPAGGDANVSVRAVLRNATTRARRVRVSARYGTRRLVLGTKVIPARAVAGFETAFRLRNAQLWDPARPYLYPVSLSASSGGRAVARYSLKSGVRSVAVSPGGRLTLNGKLLALRGVGVHEDSRQQGFAVDNAFRDRLVGDAKALGATILRSHYPLHPYLHELADRLGMLIWSEIPVYANKTDVLKQRSVRVTAAKELRKNIETNQNHPSVLLWSIANELSARPGPVQGFYIQRARNLAKRLDPTRPVGIAVAGYPSVGCQGEYGPLDVIGVNEYFGWYPGPSGQIFDRTRLAAYLDSVRACYPNKAIFVSEFGAEANRDGPVEEKGTWLFQQDFVNFHLGVYATKPWLAGAIYWALNEFRVRPSWEGGNPRPQPPVHQKGLLTYDWVRKPAWTDAQRWFVQTPQLAAPVRGR
jgi:beta-glucuronidase